MSTPILKISRSAFRSNIAVVRERLGDSQLMLVMKDDAYGHGLEWSVPEAETAGITWFGSYDVPTALRIRELTARRVYAWAPSSVEEVETAVQAGIELGVGDIEYLRVVIDTAERLRTPVGVHLKIDTGLHRNGFRPEDWHEAVQLARDAEKNRSIRIVGAWSHLAEASDAEDDLAQQVFRTAVQQLEDAGGTPEVLHLTASAAAWWRPELRGSLSRIGAFCYGIRSADGPQLDGLSLISSLIATVDAVEGDRVRIGVGAFHGLPSTLRGAQLGTPHGKRALIEVGGDNSVVEGWSDAAEGDEVVVFGPGAAGEVDATALAERIDTVGEEILTRLTPAVRRVIGG